MSLGCIYHGGLACNNTYRHTHLVEARYVVDVLVEYVYSLSLEA